ncbi:MAG TPA: glutamate ABC transporter substrate-binding protein [Acidimicrobiia bacterium]|jgi:polar amino acid transport system substrate-binding protein|nr:glutamate ABC transporter substrate-binding protein [Acidimicrobiia bacterium]
MSARRWTAVAAATVVLVGLAACSSPSNGAVSRSLGALTDPTTTTAAPSPATTTAPTPCDPRASFAPDPTLPMPTVKAIQTRGRLVVGVDQGTLHWGYRDPRDGTINGLDVDILRQIALAIFGSDPDAHLQFKTLTTAERIQAVESGKVDMVASLLTATCDRWNDVDFSTVYYDAHQDVLVPIGSPVQTVTALAGKTVCATRGSTSITNIQQKVPTVKIYPVDTRADCLVALQDGQVDAITSDDTILHSFQDQEEKSDTRLLEQPLEAEPYAIAMPKHHEDLVRFVNDVLDRMRNDGTLELLYGKWLGVDPPPPPPPAPVYGR